MEEKLKIYVPEGVQRILMKDMELFEFYKKDGTLNRNDFYNTLIVNYYETYQRHNEVLFTKIRKVLAEDVPKREVEDLSYRILQLSEDSSERLDSGRKDVTISIKPTKNSSSIFRFIEDTLIKNSTLSRYFRDLFASYSLLPQDKRERIIFKENFEALEKAIARHRKVYFQTAANETAHVASPYVIADSKEELFNYLLCEYRNTPYSFRISRMKKVIVLEEASSIKEETKHYLEKMKKNGPQFAYDSRRDTSLIKVRFTKRGEEMYKKIYLHRPAAVAKEGNVYLFECSAGQAYQYFSRFSRNAVILEPESLYEDMKKFYGMGVRAYQAEEKEKLPQEL